MDARRAVRGAARVAVALVSTAVLVATGVGWSLARDVEQAVASDALPDAAPVPEGEPFTVLLVGLDARTDAQGDPLPRALLDALHAGPDEGQLHTDTIILLRVPAEGPAVAVSIPRDSYVPLADGSGRHKINSAYGRAFRAFADSPAADGLAPAELDRRAREAGRRAVVATVQAFTGASIDHLAEVNLAGFVELTEALGGVPVCLREPVRDRYSGLDLPAGPQTVTGPAALAFVRQRHGLEGGDLDRITRQQAFVAGLAQRLRDAGALADPARLQGLVRVATRHVVLDRGWALTDAVAQLRRLASDDVVFRTIPTVRPDLRTPSDGVAVEVDPAAVRAFVAEQFAPPATAATTTAPTPAAAPTTPVPTTPVPTTPAAPPISTDRVPCVA